MIFSSIVNLSECIHVTPRPLFSARFAVSSWITYEQAKANIQAQGLFDQSVQTAHSVISTASEMTNRVSKQMKDLGCK